MICDLSIKIFLISGLIIKSRYRFRYLFSLSLNEKKVLPSFSFKFGKGLMLLDNMLILSAFIDNSSVFVKNIEGPLNHLTNNWKFIYKNINNGVYRSGFATTQEAYDEAIETLFNGLDKLEDILSKNRFLLGDQITESDWRFLPTLLRFDSVYHGHFKCNKKHIYEYSNLWNFTLELYQYPGIAEITNFEHIKRGYYHLMPNLNPNGIVAKGPNMNFKQKHNRDRF